MINPPRQPRAFPPPIPIQLPKLLLVEGDTPLHFFEALLKQLGLSNDVEIHDFRGNQDLAKYLKTLVATSGFSLVASVGIVRDAEKQPLQDIEASLKSAVAAALPPNVKVASFILPDNSNPGMIETLWIEAIRSDPSLGPVGGCIDAFFDCMRHNQIPIPADHAVAKHQIQVFLATRPEVQLPPGIAAARGYLPWDSPAFDSLKQFVRSL